MKGSIFGNIFSLPSEPEYIYGSALSIIPMLSGEPKTLITYSNITNKATHSKIRLELSGKSGIYSFINNVDGKHYVGSAKDLHKGS